MDFIESLFETIQKRPRPEDIADLILVEIGGDLSESEYSVVDKAARHSFRRGLHRFSSMAQDFHRPVAPTRQSAKALELFSSAFPLTPANCCDIRKVRDLLDRIRLEILKQAGIGSFKFDRLNRINRKEAGLDCSRRRYNKLFRFLNRFEEKLVTFERENRKYRASRIAKSSLATLISFEDFSASREAACFIAYFSARLNRRSVFTNQSQDRPFDQVAEILLNRFRKNPSPEGWRAIAHVMPDAEIIERLEERDKMSLLGNWLSILEDVADLLRETWDRSHFDRASMIVRRGDDSSTWNSLAGAWNAARQGWISLVVGLGMDETLDRLCFGKVMRVMAADVAAWHRLSGGKLEPDTFIWAELPPPWEVFAGSAECTRDQVEKLCQVHKVDPEAKGWTAPRRNRTAVPFQPTPELVHGVVVSNPQLATILKKAGWFSGKETETVPPPCDSVSILRDNSGFALRVTSDPEEMTASNLDLGNPELHSEPAPE